MRWLLFALLAPTAAFGQQADPFFALDANDDGKLSLSEVPEQVRPHFKRTDTNSDGFVTREEFQAATGLIPDKNAPGPVGLEVLKDVDYVGKGNGRQNLDVVLQKDRKGKKRPLVVVVHGGGWLAGRKEDGLGLARLMASTGEYSTATINYRLTQEAGWPAQIHDCKAAIRFLRGKAAEYGIDPERIGVLGYSAGGHLVSMLGTGNDEPTLEGSLGAFPGVSSRVQCVVNFFGPTDFLTFFGKDTSPEKIAGEKMASQLLGKTPEQIRINAKSASPVTWITKDDAPFLTAHGTKDPIVPYAQATEIHEALGKAGVESHLIKMVGGGHGFESADLNNRIKLFLDKHLRGMTAEIPGEPIVVQ